ncbi:PREDICTED: U3 small nucleolar ribonucleoprotein protein MPP10 [Galeopterus variegatus]|uniref:U3 small nucleolar ribonucleoprotein protein MPP10 n=1 Tax=Galeopterus variegatus TaxID=482537 RepID=A0ABM0QEI2_GALVR|nr:PREDICTED: U3 small nucleolar ribonucleoprotein protein MPP10 [Galeopterus variegatus]
MAPCCSPPCCFYDFIRELNHPHKCVLSKSEFQVLKSSVSKDFWNVGLGRGWPCSPPPPLHSAHRCAARSLLSQRPELLWAGLTNRSVVLFSQEKNKAGDVKTAGEKTATDKKRERRKKKHQKRMKIKQKEKQRKLLEKSNPDQAGKHSKAAASEKLKELTKTGKVSLLKDKGKDKALKSSRAFFSKLQDQVKMQINDVKRTEKKKKKRQDISIHKLKL